MKRIFAATLLIATLTGQALAQSANGFDAEVRLDSGNIELAVIDGTTISVAPGSHLTISHAKGPGDLTRINVLKGEFRISNVLHKHSNVVLIRTGDHTFELNRGSALIQHTGTGPQGTLLHGTSLSIQGRDRTLTRPGRRLKVVPGSGAIQEDRSDSEAFDQTMNKVSGRKAALSPTGQRDGRQNVLRDGFGRKQNGRRGFENRVRSQIQQRGGLITLIQSQQGAANSPKPPKPPKIKPSKPPKVTPPKPMKQP